MEAVPEGRRGTVITYLLDTFNLHRFWLNSVECLLWETAMNRLTKIHDYYFKGQILFILSGDGQSLYKTYGEHVWRSLFTDEVVMV
jgi:hypothetical protein